MIKITAEELHKIHSRVRKWYPRTKKISNAKPSLINGLKQIANNFELILLDAYGVLVDGGLAIPSSIAVIEQLQRYHKSFCVVSNDSTKTCDEFAKTYAKQGFTITQDQVVTSLDITMDFINAIKDKSTYAAAFHPQHYLAAKLASMLSLYDYPEKIINDHISNLIFISGIGWDTNHQSRLIKNIADKKFNQIVLANPDIGAPYNDVIMATPGYFLAEIYENNNHELPNPILLGKPGYNIFNKALAKYPQITDPSKVLMVGDGIYTDILGGNSMGFTTMLIKSKLNDTNDFNRIFSDSKIYPDYIAASL